MHASYFLAAIALILPATSAVAVPANIRPETYEKRELKPDCKPGACCLSIHQKDWSFYSYAFFDKDGSRKAFQEGEIPTSNDKDGLRTYLDTNRVGKIEFTWPSAQESRDKPRDAAIGINVDNHGLYHTTHSSCHVGGWTGAIFAQRGRGIDCNIEC